MCGKLLLGFISSFDSVMMPCSASTLWAMCDLTSYFINVILFHIENDSCHLKARALDLTMRSTELYIKGMQKYFLLCLYKQLEKEYTECIEPGVF